MVPVHRAIPGALTAMLRNAPLTPEKVAFAWRAAVGPAVEKATTIELKGRVLEVRAKDPVWQREVGRSAGVIRARLQTLLGNDVVTSLDVVLQ
jgi:hypothetical protein